MPALQLHWLLRLASALLLAAPVMSATAAPIPFAGRQVQLIARELPLQQFLSDLFGQIDVPVVVSDKARGAVNGNFRGDAARVWTNIARSFNLVGYYDGAVLHIVTPGELATRTLPLSPEMGARVRQSAQELGMLDMRHTVRTTGEGTLLVAGSRRFIDQIEELSRSQTATTLARPPQGFEVHYLRYAWAQDVSAGFGGRVVVVPGVASIVRALMTNQSASQIKVLSNEQRLSPTVPKLRGQGLSSQGSSSQTNNNASANGSVAALLAAYAAENQPGGVGSGNLAVGNTNPLSPLVGLPSLTLIDPAQARVEADTRLNAVIVRDAPERLAQYKQLIQALDVEPQALEIEARIIDIDTDRMQELGINWRLDVRRASALFGNGSVDDLRLSGTVPPPQITPIGRGGFLSAVLGGGNELALRINALTEQGAAKVVSSPQVLTLSNVEAVFDTSRTFYVRVAGRDEVDLFSVSAGTTLRVTPHVFRDGNEVRIKLLVAIDDGTISSAQVDQIPIVERATINTQALIYEGESLLVGGLTREASSNGVTKIPFLGDIPILGNLFKTTSESARRTERLFLIAPRLVPARRLASAPQAVPGAPIGQAPMDVPPLNLTPTPARSPGTSELPKGIPGSRILDGGPQSPHGG